MGFRNSESPEFRSCYTESQCVVSISPNINGNHELKKIFLWQERCGGQGRRNWGARGTPECRKFRGSRFEHYACPKKPLEQTLALTKCPPGHTATHSNKNACTYHFQEIPCTSKPSEDLAVSVDVINHEGGAHTLNNTWWIGWEIQWSTSGREGKLALRTVLRSSGTWEVIKVGN